MNFHFFENYNIFVNYLIAIGFLCTLIESYRTSIILCLTGISICIIFKVR